MPATLAAHESASTQRAGPRRCVSSRPTARIARRVACPPETGYPRTDSVTRRAVPNRSSTSESVEAVARSSSVRCAPRIQPPGPGAMDKCVVVRFSFQTGPTWSQTGPTWGAAVAGMRICAPLCRFTHETLRPPFRYTQSDRLPSGHNGHMTG